MVESLVYIIARALDCSEYLLRLVPPEYNKTCFTFIFVIYRTYYLLSYTSFTTKVDNVHPYKYNKYHPGSAHGLAISLPTIPLHHCIARLAAASSHPNRLLPNLENTTYSNSLTNTRVYLYLKP